MMHPEAIPANKATSEPSILECPAWFPSVLEPRNKVKKEEKRSAHKPSSTPQQLALTETVH